MPEISSDIHQFRFRPELIEIGTVYHYIKSNIDGSYPARIFLYVRDHDQLEVLKLEAHGMDAALVSAHMDWETFSADRLESWILTPDGGRKPQARLSSSFPAPTFTIAIRDRQDVVSVGHYPVHVYNFDLISLNYILRHWNDPKGVVAIGILQPDFDPDPATMMKYEGTIEIRYRGIEERGGKLCYRYSIGGGGLRNQTGVMWVNERRIIEDLEIPVPDNPDWEDFKFKFISSRLMDPQAWADLMEAEVKRLKIA